MADKLSYLKFTNGEHIMQEQREHRRSSTEMSIRLFQNGSLQNLAKTQNLTSSGMFIQTDALLYPKDTLIDILLEDQCNSVCFKVEAKVIHRSLQGMGVEFLNPSSQQDVYEIMRLNEHPKVVA